MDISLWYHPAEMVETGVTDENLVARLVKGDRTAGDEIVRRHYRLVAKSIHDVTNDLQVVDDLMQDIFIKVLRKADLYKPELGRFVSWLVTVSRNEALNHLRSRHRTAHISLEETKPDGGFAPGESPSKEVSKKEVTGKLLENIKALEDPARTILKMRIIEGKSFEQIARVTKRQIDSVKTIFYRSTEALRTRNR